MNDKDLLQALRRLKVETGSLACLGCGHENNCGLNGCAILREAEGRIAGLCLKNKASCGYDKTGDCCGRASEPGAIAYCEEGPGVEPEEVSVKYGSYVKLNGTETPAEIEAGKAIMAEKAGEVVRDAMMGENLFIKGPGTLAWKVEIYARRITDD